jgi:hypothetical protein
MDLRSIVLYLSQKNLSVKGIHLDIVHALEHNAVGYSTVTLYLRDARCAGPMDPEAVPDHDVEPDDIDQAILTALSEQPFASVRELSWLTHVSRPVVHRLLM